MAEDTVETTTFTIEAAGETDEFTLPSTLVELLAEGDQSPVETVSDVAMLSFASRAHHLVHHGEDVEADVETAESRIMELFEERFGVTYAEATGHHH